MSAPPRPAWTRQDYDRDADEYLASLPLEHFMEATAQSIQRDVTVTSLQQLKAVRPRLRCFGELLVHWLGDDGPRRVVSDNLVVLDFSGEELFRSWAVGLAPCPLFWALEYVAESNRRKDYADNFEKYESALKIPYYLIFDPEHQDLRLYRHDGARYVPAEANAAGRYPVPEIDVEVAIRDRWARFWHKGELLPITPEMQAKLGETSRQLDEERKQRQRVEKENERIGKEKERVEQEKALLAQEKERAEKEKDRAEQRARQSEKDNERLHQRLSDHSQAMAALLRPLVEAKARLAGRQDVLDQLPTITDGEQLARWLAEMG